MKCKTVVLFAFVGMMFSACSKNETTVANDPAPAESSLAYHLFEAAKDEINDNLGLQPLLNGLNTEISGDRDGCPTVTISPQGNVFPKTVTLVFPENCTTYAGASIQGTIAITISGKVREVGSTATFTLTNFKYKGYTLNGKHTLTYLGANSHNTVVQNGVITTPLGKTISYESNNTSTQIEGLATTFKTNPTDFWKDDVYSVDVNCHGVNSKGNNFEFQTLENLIYKIGCQWIVSGKVNIQEASTPAIDAIIDYGDGSCDNQATLTIGNINTTITLP